MDRCRGFWGTGAGGALIPSRAEEAAQAAALWRWIPGDPSGQTLPALSTDAVCEATGGDVAGVSVPQPGDKARAGGSSPAAARDCGFAVNTRSPGGQVG